MKLIAHFFSLSHLCILSGFFYGCPASSSSSEINEVKAQQVQLQQKLSDVQIDLQVKIARLEEQVRILEASSPKNPVMSSGLDKQPERKVEIQSESLPSSSKTAPPAQETEHSEKKPQLDSSKPEQIRSNPPTRIIKSSTNPLSNHSEREIAIFPNRNERETEMVSAILELTNVEARARTAQANLDQVLQQDPNDPQVIEKMKQAQADVRQAQTDVNRARQKKREAEERLQQAK